MEDWFNETVINNIYDSYPDIYHDKDATELYYNKGYDAAYELVHLGARILYNDKSLPSENFDLNELEKFEGEKKATKASGHGKRTNNAILWVTKLLSVFIL